MGWCVREYICVLDDMREDARAVCVCVFAIHLHIVSLAPTS